MPTTRFAICVLLALTAVSPLAASSHREAPGITAFPKLDGTDFYMFLSYEPGREGFVTLIADYYPLQDSFGGPNYFNFEDDAVYAIHVDNTGDGVEDVSFVFDFQQSSPFATLSIGGMSIPVPLLFVAPITAGDQSGLNFFERYSIQVINGALANSNGMVPPGKLKGGSPSLETPFPNAGNKGFPAYEAYAATFVRDVSLPSCGDARVFAGQRKDPFVVNLGEIFDLINLDPVGPVNGEADALYDKNVLSIAVEVPIDCLTQGRTDIVGGWTSSYAPKNLMFETNPTFDRPSKTGGPLIRTSRLGMPLVNEVVIGLPDKDAFNASRPAGDAQFADYVTNPTLPAIIEILFPIAPAPTNFPREDLLATFVTGIPTLNEFGFGEMQRLNVDVPPTAAGAQHNLGVLGGDLAGFPNGRRPGDDVVDIELRVAMGALCHAGLGLCTPGDAPAGTAVFTDGAVVNASFFDAVFPYLRTPVPGSPNGLTSNGVPEPSPVLP